MSFKQMYTLAVENSLLMKKIVAIVVLPYMFFLVLRPLVSNLLQDFSHDWGKVWEYYKRLMAAKSNKDFIV